MDPMATDHATTHRPVRKGRPAGSRRVGYVWAIAINAVMLYLAQHLLEWEWPRFLTEDFDEVLPYVVANIVANIVANALYLFYDAGWFKSIGNIVTTGLGLIAAVRMFQVFPFDFSTYARDWSWLLRVLLVVGIVGSAIGVLVEVVRLLTWPARSHRADRA